MNKSDYKKMEQARREGMEYALRIVKRSGTEGLEKELQFRQRTQIPLSVHPDVARECIDNIKMQTCDCFLAMSILSVLDLYKGERYAVQMAQKFRNRFKFYSDMLVEEKFNWQDVVDELSDRGITQEIRLNDLDAVNRRLEEDEIPHRKVGGV